MATISELLITGAQKSAGTAGEGLSDAVGEGLKLGTQLAESIEKIQQSRRLFQEKQQEQQNKKFEAVGQWLDTYSKMPEGGAKKAFGRNYIPQGIRALGLDKDIHPDIISMSTSDPNFTSFLLSKVRNKEISNADLRDPTKAAAMYAKYGQQFGDMEKFQATIADNNEALNEGEKLAIQEEGKTSRTIIGQQGQNNRQRETIETTGQTALAKKSADDYATFVNQGGLASAESKLKKLEEGLSKLKDGRIKTGSIGKALPIIGGDKAQAVIDPQFKALADDVRGAISLKGQLDSQFSAKEAEIQFNRAFDGALPTKENIRKVEGMLNQLRGDLKSKVSEFKRQGFPVGEAEGVGKKKSAPPAPKYDAKLLKGFIEAAPDPATKAARIKRAAQELGVSEAEAKKQLGL